MDAHLGVKEAHGSLDDGGQVVKGRDLEDVALGAGDDSGELDADVLGLHVEGEGVGEALALAGGDLDVVLDGGEVVDDALVGGGVLGEVLGGDEGAGNEGDLQGPVLAVVDLDEGVGRAAVDQLDTEDVGLGEGRGDLGVEHGGVSGGGTGLSILEASAAR